jgi:hypothetical protein
MAARSAERTMPAFLITIDTEGDDLWSGPAEITTRNAAFLPRFQALCESHGFRPTYLTNYEMASDPHFAAFARRVIRDGAGEVGMHLHAWHSPPHFELTPHDTRYMPYLVEYPDEVMRDKITFMTRLLEDTFGVAVQSHRAGRWAFDKRYAAILGELNYTADCSVTPNVDWRGAKGAPDGPGGTDYRSFPAVPYFIDPDDIAAPGRSGLLEVPMTTVDTAPPLVRELGRSNAGAAGRLRRRIWPVHWLRPNGRNLAAMQRLIDRCVAEGGAYVEFMLHSSELMPGGSPTFRTEASIEALYRDMDALFAYASARFGGETLADFARRWSDEHARAPAGSSSVLKKSD